MNPVRLEGLRLEIHPYVKGRLRLQRRQDEPGGILLGKADGEGIQITGSKCVPKNGLRHAAEAAGPALIGFYRLRTPAAPVPQAEEEELWRKVQPEGPGVFLLVQAVNGVAGSATAWIRQGDGPAVSEEISLVSGGEGASSAPVRREIERRERRAFRFPRWAMVGSGMAVLVLLAGWYFLGSRPVAPVSPRLDVQAREGEIVAVWDQPPGGPARSVQSAAMIVRQGDKEQRIDLTSNYTPQGRIVVRPTARDIFFTLQVQYVGIPPVSASAVYLGFEPKIEPKPEPKPEKPPVRRRNRNR